MVTTSSFVSHLLLGTAAALVAFGVQVGAAHAADPVCGAGFVPAIGGGCVDFDECAAGIDSCDDTQLCVNREGTYTCGCAEGLTAAVGGGCIDVDECAAGTDECGEDEVCVNREGTYTCNCADGFRKAVGGGCTDIDECAEGSDQCDATETCTNRMGTYTCACDAGFEPAVGGGCADINECALGIDTCADNQTCVNRQGTFSCSTLRTPTLKPAPKTKAVTGRSALESEDVPDADEGDDEGEAGMLCSAGVGGATDPSAVLTILGALGVLISRRRKA